MASQKVTLKVDGNQYEGFDDVSINRNIEEFCGSFSFTAFTESNIQLPFKPSQICEIFIDGGLFMTGKIDRTAIGYNKNSHYIQILGRDKTSVIVDNSCIGNVNFSTPINLVLIIEDMLSRYNLDIDVNAELGGIDDFAKQELPSGEEGENLFSFIEKLARQRGLLLRTDEAGDIRLEKKQGSKYNVLLLNEINGQNNNILEGNFDRNYTQRYYRYSSHSQTNLSSNIQSALDTNIKGQYIDTGDFVDQSKYLEIESEISDTGTSNAKRAEWEGRIRKARSEIYSCKLQGFIAETSNNIKDYWKVNRLVKVKDDFCEINDILLTKRVTFEYSTSKGSITTLELVDKDAYLLESEL